MHPEEALTRRIPINSRSLMVVVAEVVEEGEVCRHAESIVVQRSKTHSQVSQQQAWQQAL